MHAAKNDRFVIDVIADDQFGRRRAPLKTVALQIGVPNDFLPLIVMAENQ